jgi:hypothetical protein
LVASVLSSSRHSPGYDRSTYRALIVPFPI